VKVTVFALDYLSEISKSGGVMSKKRKGKPAKYRLRNWSFYNNALRSRGKIVFMLTDESKKCWIEPKQEHAPPGAPPKLTAKSIEVCLQIREIFHLPLRQTQGFIEGLFEKAGVRLPVPDYTLLSKRAGKLNLKVNRYKPKESQYLPDEPITITIDSTGMKIYGEGEWLKEKHKINSRKTWKRAHIVIDQHGNIIAEKLTSTAVGDSTGGVELLKQIGNLDVTDFYGDGAYDSRLLHNELELKFPELNIVTPPRKDAVVSSRDRPTQRDKHIMMIEEKGREAWQAISGYNKRNLVENTMFRIKTIFGGKLKSIETENQKTEFTIKTSLLNKMSSLGMPDAYKVREN